MKEPFVTEMNEVAFSQLLRLARSASHIVAFTGAGISTESGIPDYRGPGGVWARNTPPTLSEFLESEATRRTYWSERRERYPALRDTAPNNGHAALARLQDTGLLSAVITQNIDGLHQKSGINDERLIELHGSAHRIRCLACGANFSACEVQDRLELEPIPACSICGGILRAGTVLFGEPLSGESLRRAVAAAIACDLMLVVGSSLIVQPAARMPRIAVSSGARLAIVNLDATPLDDLADVVVRGGAGVVLQRLTDELLGETAQAETGWHTGQ